MDSKITKICDGFLEAGWLLAVIAVPLFFNIHSERVFEPDKLVLLRSIALFMLGVMLVRFVETRGWGNLHLLRWRDENSIWRLPFVLPVTILLVVYLVSTLFSITPRVSWAGSYQRLQGTYTTFSYVVIFIAAVTTIRKRVQINRIVTAVIITSIPISFYGLLQHFGLDPLPWGGDVEARIAGHMGNSIFIAAYLIMAVPLTLSRIIDAFTNILSDERLSYSDVLRSSIYIFALATQLLAIYWSGSRGPLIGLAVGLFSFMLVLLVSLHNAAADRTGFGGKDFLWALVLISPPFIALLFSKLFSQTFSPFISVFIFIGCIFLSVLLILIFVALRRGWKWLWMSWLLLTVLGAGWLLMFNIPASQMESLQNLPGLGPIFEAQLEWKELPTIGSYGKMLDPSQTIGREKSNRVRVLIWEGVIDLIRPHEPLQYPDGTLDKFNFLRPLIGYGPESMYVAYNKFYPPELATVEARNASPDRSHNETFDALVITGLIGFLAWQALYISVFYYGFKYLGVVGSKRDRNILIGTWIGGAFLGGALALLVLDPIYLGVAIPTGTIVALIVYLFYYALFSRNKDGEVSQKERESVPFLTARLLMNALLAAVLAHYVEIHFGIAISATRLYFFLYIGLMYLISYKLPLTRAQKKVDAKARNKRRSVTRKPHQNGEGQWGPVLLWMFLLAFIVGILGYEFTNYVLPPDQVIETGADLSASAIFHQSFFVNPQRNFADSPFIYLMIVLTWALGLILAISEMVKNGELRFDFPENAEIVPKRQKLAAGMLAVLAVVGLIWRFIFSNATNASASLGRSLVLLGAVICGWAAFRLIQDKKTGLPTAVGVSSACLILSLPVLIGGSWAFSVILLVFSLILLYLLWDKAWRTAILLPIVLGIFSLLIGLLYTFFHATLLREALLYLIFYQDIAPVSSLYSMFFRPGSAIETVPELRVLEARQSMRFLSSFYLFMFAMWVSSALSISWDAVSRERVRGTAPGYATAVIVILLGFWAVGQTNVRVVQADMVYKRGKPFDNQAMIERDPLNWDVAIAIYEEALKLAPWEDFYYLFLGRALLERSAVVDDPSVQVQLLSDAESKLITAQKINPLNTDHTANLARLNTRWAATEANSGDVSDQINKAEKYYQDALKLSPQNSIIRNEYARFALELDRDCEKAIQLYEESLDIDPYYDETYFAFTDALVSCASAQTEENAQRELYTLAAGRLAEGLTLQPGNARAWLQSGQILQRIDRFNEALEAFERARTEDNGASIPLWNIDFLEASVYRDMGDLDMARALAEQALKAAPTDVSGQIESFLASLDSG